MKKKLELSKFNLLIIAVLLGSLCSPVSATLITDIDGLDLNPTYWDRSDNNPSDKKELANSNPITEEAWLEALLGKYYNDQTVNYYTKVNYGDVPLIGILSDFDWQYAVVKHGAYWTAFESNFVGGAYIKNVSHITYFNAAPVPEPASMLLFGSGLIVLGFVRKFKRA